MSLYIPDAIFICYMYNDKVYYVLNKSTYFFIKLLILSNICYKIYISNENFFIIFSLSLSLILMHL